MHEAKENDTGDVVAVAPPADEPQIITPDQQIIAPTLGEGPTTDNIYLLQEGNRPGEYMPAFEDEHGTYIMNSKDLRAVQMVERLTKIGCPLAENRGTHQVLLLLCPHRPGLSQGH